MSGDFRPSHERSVVKIVVILKDRPPPHHRHIRLQIIWDGGLRNSIELAFWQHSLHAEPARNLFLLSVWLTQLLLTHRHRLFVLCSGRERFLHLHHHLPVRRPGHLRCCGSEVAQGRCLVRCTQMCMVRATLTQCSASPVPCTDLNARVTFSDPSSDPVPKITTFNLGWYKSLALVIPVLILTLTPPHTMQNCSTGALLVELISAPLCQRRVSTYQQISEATWPSSPSESVKCLKRSQSCAADLLRQPKKDPNPKSLIAVSFSQHVPKNSEPHQL